jgi:hypothetical protein
MTQPQAIQIPAAVLWKELNLLIYISFFTIY